ncbi:unnamed protein product, partial [Heterotrigona itama]
SAELKAPDGKQNYKRGAAKREKQKKRRERDETARQESRGQRGMQFAVVCRRVTAFTDFENDSTHGSRLLWFRSSAFPLIATTPTIILPEVVALPTGRLLLVDDHRWHPMAR